VAIEQLEIPGADGSIVQISGSLGVADTGSVADADAFLKRADEALYSAKRAGKNRVVSAPERAATAA
jgi:PleD family two-component response regulator